MTDQKGRKPRQKQLEYRKNLWLPTDLKDRAERVATADRRRLVDVFRYAVELGLDELEAKLGIKKQSAKPGK